MPEAKPKVNQIEVVLNGQVLPTDMIDNIAEVEVSLSMTLPDMFILRMYDVGAVFTNDALFTIGNAAEVKMTDPDDPNSTPQTVFKGEITAVEPEFQLNNKVLLTIRGYDKTHRMNRGTKTETFKNVKDSDIVSKIAGQYGLSKQITQTSQVYDHVFQDAQTDYDFVTMLAERNGFEFFVNDGKLYFGKPSSVSEHKLEWGTTLQTFNPRLSVSGQIDEVIVRGWDPMQKKEIVGTAKSSSSAPSINVGGSGGDVAGKSFGKAKQVMVREPVFTVKEAEARAKSILDKVNANFVEADGRARCKPKLKVGDKVKIDNLGSKFSGSYVVTTVTHVYAPGGMNETYFKVEGRKPRLMGDLIGGSGESSAESSGSGGNTDIWAGVYPAIVTNIDDPEKLGRVKVKYPWLGDNMESWWCRVVAIGAGGGRGLQNTPEVDDEVLIAFEHGNFNFPYVLGNLWGGKNKPPENAAVEGGKVNVRSLTSREGHVIRLTDGQNPKIEIIDSAKGTKITLDAQGKHLNIDTNQNVTIKGGGNLTLEATQDVTIKGMNVKIDAQTTMEAKAMTAKINGSATTEIKGGIVKIN